MRVRITNIIGNILSILCSVLYCFGYLIAEYFYGDDIEPWVFLRNTLKGFVYFLLSVLFFLPVSRFKDSIIFTLSILFLGDVVDRVCFGINFFTESDKVFILFAIGIGIFLLTYKNYDKTILGRSRSKNFGPCNYNRHNSCGRGIQ